MSKRLPIGQNTAIRNRHFYKTTAHKNNDQKRNDFCVFAPHSGFPFCLAAANGILQAYFLGSSCVSFAGDVSGAFGDSLPVVSPSIV